MWVVKVTVRVGFVEQAQTQPAEVMVARGASHFVAAVYFLHTRKRTQTHTPIIEVMSSSNQSRV